jgi:uncharacterized protein (DUF302 family)
MKTLALLLSMIVPAALFAAEPAPATQPAPAATPPSTQEGGWIAPVQTPYGPVILQQGMMPPQRDFQMSRVISPEERKRYLQMSMPMMANMMQLDAREAMNYMVVKYQVKPGVSFDEAVQSLKLRANRINFKFVGENLMWKDFRAVLGDDSAPRVEVFSFCDIAIGRELLKIVPEMVVFLPCRIAIMEDAQKNIWILALDWDFTWLDYAGKSLGLTPEVRQGIADIRVKMDDMMRAAANGDI